MPRSTATREPPHTPTAKTRRTVAICRMSRMSDEELAASLEISVNQLHAHYAEELVTGAAKMRKELVEAVFMKALSGSSAAVKNLMMICSEPLPPDVKLPRDLLDAMEHAIRTQRSKRARAAAPEEGEREIVRSKKLGKKEAANLDAETAGVGTKWGDILPGQSALQ